MLDAALQEQLKTYLAYIRQPIELVASLDTGEKSAELLSLLNDVAALSGNKVSVVRDDADARKPSFAIRAKNAGTDAVSVRFAGIPMGHEFNSLVLALLQVGGHPSKTAEAIQDQIKALDGDYVFETYFSLSCQNCPDVVQALNLMASLNPRIRHVAIDGALFQAEVDQRQIMAVPAIYLNGQPFAQGRMSLEQILARLDTGAARRDAAAIDAARKGIRTGVVAERFGGQILDTMAIENFVSVPHTEGPKLAAALEQHVAAYGVDIMAGQKAASLIPAQTPEDMIQVRLDSGATVKARSVILSTGARWRTMAVPGEDQYRNKGVAFCPHCDGPLFKGKRVAVIGGGNSGVEAAIDLAGIVAHVTLLEFDGTLRADAVLQAKLRSLPNVDVVTSAQTTEVIGDGAKVTGLAYKSRQDGETRRIDLDGVFVQIGLVPNTEWLKGTLALSPRGEIEVDARGQTSVPGVFAAGDATTSPFKQIIIAMGDGAKASLAAFDHLIRSGVPAQAA